MLPQDSSTGLSKVPRQIVQEIPNGLVVRELVEAVREGANSLIRLITSAGLPLSGLPLTRGLALWPPPFANE